MKIKNIELPIIIEGMNAIAQEKIPFPVAMEIAEISEKINSYAKIYADAEKKIFVAYCRRDEEGNPVTPEGEKVKDGKLYIHPDNIEKAAEELKELREYDIKFDFNQIDIGRHRKKMDEISVPPAALMTVKRFFK